jgi:DNA-directed RNA polymerase beta' subunit
MSSMLDQAIVDAKELKEAAIKSAESTIIEKYSQEIKEAVDTMLNKERSTSPKKGCGGRYPNGSF